MLTDCLNKVGACVDSLTGLTLGDPDSPFRNFSSEQPDTPLYRSFVTGGGGEDDPTLHYKQGCVSLCVSEESQEEADLCAARQATLCTFDEGDVTGGNGGTGGGGNFDPWEPPIGGGGGNNPGGGNGGGPPSNDPTGGGGTPTGDPSGGGGPTLYYSAEASCSETCSDGSVFTKTIAAGKFVDITQARADKKAQDYACAQAEAFKICFGVLNPEELCTWVEVEMAVSIFGTNAPYTVLITQGGLPPGLVLSSNETGTVIFISGTPTAAGTYNFTLEAEGSSGNKQTADYELRVYGFTNPPGPLMDALINRPYTAMFLAGGPLTEPLYYSAGGLPSGLSVDHATGVISGTPTEDGAFVVAVVVTDADGRECRANHDLYVVDCATFQTQASFSGELSCSGGEEEYDVPLSYCDTPIRVKMGIADTFRNICGTNCEPFDFSVTGQIIVYAGDGSTFVTFTCANVAPFSSRIDQLVTIPGQFLDEGPLPYRIKFVVINVSVTEGWTCAETTVDISAQSEYP